mmetsp:Transcript_10738/g.15708  ORF Transcript_10738/g.15708 Transcript_10738/m.15708 type:complete len:170 (+) Transcript_10738:46-555(+)
MSIVKAIRRAFERGRERHWDRLYWYFDLHEVVLKPNYDERFCHELYPDAERVLKDITNRPDIVPCLYTCSHPDQIQFYIDFFAKKGIRFVYVNENPEVAWSHSSLGNYSSKPYMNVLFEDKAGFDFETDWTLVEECMKDFPVGYLPPTSDKKHTCNRGPPTFDPQENVN